MAFVKTVDHMRLNQLTLNNVKFLNVTVETYDYLMGHVKNVNCILYHRKTRRIASQTIALRINVIIFYQTDSVGHVKVTSCNLKTKKVVL